MKWDNVHDKYKYWQENGFKSTKIAMIIIIIH
jgi:hypothetical protein